MKMFKVSVDKYGNVSIDENIKFSNEETKYGVNNAGFEVIVPFKGEKLDYHHVGVFHPDEDTYVLIFGLFVAQEDGSNLFVTQAENEEEAYNKVALFYKNPEEDLFWYRG